LEPGNDFRLGETMESARGIRFPGLVTAWTRGVSSNELLVRAGLRDDDEEKTRYYVV